MSHIAIVMNRNSEMHAELDEQEEAARASVERDSVLSDVTALDQQLAALRAQVDALRAERSQTHT